MIDALIAGKLYGQPQHVLEPVGSYGNGSHGLMIVAPVGLKSATLRVTTGAQCDYVAHCYAPWVSYRLQRAMHQADLCPHRLWRCPAA